MIERNKWRGNRSCCSSGSQTKRENYSKGRKISSPRRRWRGPCALAGSRSVDPVIHI